MVGEEAQIFENSTDIEEEFERQILLLYLYYFQIFENSTDIEEQRIMTLEITVRNLMKVIEDLKSEIDSFNSRLDNVEANKS